MVIADGPGAGYGGRPMAVLPTAFLDILREKGDLSRWPGVLAVDEALRARVEAALATLPADVGETFLRRVMSTRTGDATFGRALLWAAAKARVMGASVEGLHDDSSMRLVSASGVPFLLATAVFQMDRDARGAPDAVGRLVRTLEGGFAGRRFALAVRRPVPVDFDSDAVSRAVTLWVRAVERGDWRGRHAVYDDERLSIELTLLQAAPAATGQGLTFLVGPSVSLDRLAAVDAHLQAVGRRYVDARLPLVVSLVGEPTWGVSRGYATQLLYGTAQEVRASSDAAARSWTAAYPPDGLGLFADPQFRRLAALWWLEPDARDPLEARGWAHDNPWVEGAAGLPAFPGPRCARHDAPEGVGPTGRVWMAWTAPANTAGRP